jgi:hypothetical protein
MKVETQSSTQASSALRARSQTRPCCRAAAAQRAAQRASQLRNHKSQSAKHDIYGLAIGALQTDRMHSRAKKVWLHASKYKLHEKSSLNDVFRNLNLQNHLVRHQPSTYLRPCKHFLRAGPCWGIRKSLRKSQNVRKCRTNSSTSQARYLRPCKHLCGLGHRVVYERRLGSQPEHCEMFMNVEQMPATFFTNVSG